MTASLLALEDGLRQLGSVVVAFSGGADSALLAKVAHDTLGREKVRCVTAISPSLAPEEEADCRRLADEWGLNWSGVLTDEFDDPDYLANGPDRCAHCKSALMRALIPIAAAAAASSTQPAATTTNAQPATIILGVNLDDLGDHRPGQQAAQEAGARFPLVEAGFTKKDVRHHSRALNLRTWDKPAAPCLSSRLPYGTPVTLGALSAVARAEAALRALGLREVRVRHHGDVGRIEVGPDDIGLAVERRDEVVASVKAAGYRYVALDLEGFRSGSLNRVLVADQAGGKEGR